MSRFLRVRTVDDEGVTFLAFADRPVDVCVDGRRVWTFWTRRDTDPVPMALRHSAWPSRRAAWPVPLRRHLNGTARISVRDSATGTVFYDRDRTLGDGEGPILVQNRKGIDLGIDKSGRLGPTFAGRSSHNIAALLDATESVLGALRDAGIEPFVAYGTLLGAVREGTVLGHDSDADIGYVSRHTNPVDVARESFEVQRRLLRDGWRITRYSGGSFKIYVEEGEVTRGLDVFGGFFDAGRLYLMGEVGTEFQLDWIFPLGTATLEGREVPVPAHPDKLLAAMYGPGWQKPDPAFKFETPARTIRAFDDWFRGTQPRLRHWDRRASVTSRRPMRRRPSALARSARKAAASLEAEVLDIGAGRAVDSLWLARRGLSVTAYDYVPRGMRPAEEVALAEDLDVEFRYLNLTELRSVLAEGARLASSPRPRVILANHVVDATSSEGRVALARLCSMALRGGGRLFAEFHLPSDLEPSAWMVGEPDAESFTRLLREAGASRVDVKVVDVRRRPTARVVGVW